MTWSSFTHRFLFCCLTNTPWSLSPQVVRWQSSEWSQPFKSLSVALLSVSIRQHACCGVWDKLHIFARCGSSGGGVYSLQEISMYAIYLHKPIKDDHSLDPSVVASPPCPASLSAAQLLPPSQTSTNWDTLLWPCAQVKRVEKVNGWPGMARVVWVHPQCYMVPTWPSWKQKSEKQTWFQFSVIEQGRCERTLTAAKVREGRVQSDSSVWATAYF